MTLLSIVLLFGTFAMFVEEGQSVGIKVFLRPHHKGQEFTVTGMKKVGDCHNFDSWNNKVKSLQIPVGVCVALYDAPGCRTGKRHIDHTCHGSPWAADLRRQKFGRSLSSMKLVQLPGGPEINEGTLPPIIIYDPAPPPLIIYDPPTEADEADVTE